MCWSLNNSIQHTFHECLLCTKHSVSTHCVQDWMLWVAPRRGSHISRSLQSSPGSWTQITNTDRTVVIVTMMARRTWKHREGKRCRGKFHRWNCFWAGPWRPQETPQREEHGHSHPKRVAPRHILSALYPLLMSQPPETYIPPPISKLKLFSPVSPLTS